jgi:hypothetical protein
VDDEPGRVAGRRVGAERACAVYGLSPDMIQTGVPDIEFV